TTPKKPINISNFEIILKCLTARDTTELIPIPINPEKPFVIKVDECWIQVANATLLNNNFSILSMGVSKLYLFLGLLFNFASISSISLSDILEKSVPFGKYCLINPFKFSLAPRCQGEYG